EISEAVFVGVLIESVGVFDRQTVFFEPLIRNRGVHLGVLQRRRQAVCADKMFFRNEQPGALAGFPLCRILELLRRAIEFDRDWGLRGRLSPGGLRSDESVAKLNGAPPNADRGNEKE